MSEKTAPKGEDDKPAVPSAGKQIMVMGIIVVGIFVVLGGGMFLSQLLGK
jgi:hypothetical protein